MQYSFCECAKGPLLIAIDGAGLRHVEFMQGERPVLPQAEWQRDDAALAPFVEQFAAYFAGRLRRFDLPLAATGTPFQQAVWRALCDIPYGETVSYLQIAEAIGNPRAVRAVGALLPWGGSGGRLSRFRLNASRNHAARWQATSM